MNLLSPDKSTKLVHLYHYSNKLLIPLIGVSIGAHSFTNENDMTKYIDSLNVLNVGFHSYVSTSCILTDYVKHVNINKFSKFLNLKCHVIGATGLLYFLYKK